MKSSVINMGKLLWDMFEEIMVRVTALLLTTLLVLFLLYPIIPEGVWDSLPFSYVLKGSLIGILYFLLRIPFFILKHAYLDWRQHKA